MYFYLWLPTRKVNIFDSLRSGDISVSTKEVIATIMCTTRKSILLSFGDVQLVMTVVYLLLHMNPVFVVAFTPH